MSESSKSFSDPLIERRYTVKLAQKGFGIHPERDFLYMYLGDKTKVPFNELLQKLAEIHYEADFVIGTTADEFEDDPVLIEDNIYEVTEIDDDIHSFLEYKSRAILTEEVAMNTEQEELINIIGEALKKEKFTRDETTKVYIYKIATKHR